LSFSFCCSVSSFFAFCPFALITSTTSNASANNNPPVDSNAKVIDNSQVDSKHDCEQQEQRFCPSSRPF